MAAKACYGSAPTGYKLAFKLSGVLSKTSDDDDATPIDVMLNAEPVDAFQNDHFNQFRGYIRVAIAVAEMQPSERLNHECERPTGQGTAEIDGKLDGRAFHGGAGGQAERPRSTSGGTISAKPRSLGAVGPPTIPHIVGLTLELTVVPLMVVWQTRVARGAAGP